LTAVVFVLLINDYRSQSVLLEKLQSGSGGGPLAMQIYHKIDIS